MQVFNAGSGEALRTIAMERPPLSVAMSPGGVFVAAAVGTKVGIWSADGDEPSYRELPDQGSLVLSVAYDTFGQRLATSCQDGSVRLWDATGRPLLDGKSLFTDGTDRTAQKPSAVFAAVFGSNGSEIFAGSFDGWLRVADAASGKELPKRAQLLKRPILGLTVTDDQRRLVADTLADAELQQHDRTSVIEHSFTVAPMIVDASGRSPAVTDADIAGALEMLQTGNALEVTDEQGRRSVAVVPLDRRFRLGPLPPDDLAGRVAYARQIKLSALPSVLRNLSLEEQVERGLSSYQEAEKSSRGKPAVAPTTAAGR